MTRPKLTKTQTDTIRAIVNIFETGAVHGDYGRLSLHPDDPGHLTYGRAQATLASGNLALLVRAYCDAPGAVFSELAVFLPALEARDAGLDHDAKLRELLARAGADPVMWRTQDAFFDRVYLDPAVQACARLGLALPLSVAVVYDGCVHGSFARLRDRMIDELGRPAVCGEKRWVGGYVVARRKWLAEHANPLLRETVYRMDAFQQLIRQGKWSLRLPITVHGVVVNRSVFGRLQDQVVRASAHDPAERVLQLTVPRMSGEDVEHVQRALGLDEADVDGEFGPGTELAVRKFQKESGLSVDGKVGAATRAALGV